MAEYTLFAGETNRQLRFTVTDPVGVPLTNPGSATVTWRASDGRERGLTLIDAASSVFAYTVSGGDYPGTRLETGQVRVSVGTSGWWLSAFTLRVLPHL